MKHVASRGGRTKSALWTILGILAELMLTAAAICAPVSYTHLTLPTKA